MKKILTSLLLLSGCFDLDALQSGLCKPECPTGYGCNIENKCVKIKPVVGVDIIPDGGAPPDFATNSTECFSYYVPGYQKNMYPNNLPKNKCDKCTDTDTSHCGPGNKVKETYCMNDAVNVLYETDVDGIHYKDQVYAVLNQTTVSESVELNGKLLCQRDSGSPYKCNTTYMYVMWWCDSII